MMSAVSLFKSPVGLKAMVPVLKYHSLLPSNMLLAVTNRVGLAWIVILLPETSPLSFLCQLVTSPAISYTASSIYH